jgi:hypothetical protein
MVCEDATPHCRAALRDHRARLPEALTVCVPKLQRLCENHVTIALAECLEIRRLVCALTKVQRINQGD